jgi:hypothetical protein
MASEAHYGRAAHLASRGAAISGSYAKLALPQGGSTEKPDNNFLYIESRS